MDATTATLFSDDTEIAQRSPLGQWVVLLRSSDHYRSTREAFHAWAAVQILRSSSLAFPAWSSSPESKASKPRARRPFSSPAAAVSWRDKARSNSSDLSCAAEITWQQRNTRMKRKGNIVTWENRVKTRPRLDCGPPVLSFDETLDFTSAAYYTFVFTGVPVRGSGMSKESSDGFDSGFETLHCTIFFRFSPSLGVGPSEPHLSRNFWDRALAPACTETWPSDLRRHPPLGMTCDPKPPANMRRYYTLSKLKKILLRYMAITVGNNAERARMKPTYTKPFLFVR